MRLAVIGNCQVRVLADALQLMLPDFKVEKYFLGLQNDYVAVSESLENCDYVISHQLFHVFGPLETSVLRKRFEQRFCTVPSIVFDGLQPDCMYFAHEGKIVLSPMGSYHSAIAIKAFLLGLSEREALTRYNPFLYSALGYLDEFDQELGRLIAYADSLEFDLRPLLASWRLPFMHTINHPTKEVLISLSEFACERLNLPAQHLRQVDEQVTDHMLEGGKFPVYPEVAALLGFDGGMDFATHFFPPHNTARHLSFEDFLTQSLVAYRSVSRDALEKAIANHSVRFMNG